MYFSFFVGVLWFFFRYALLCVHSSVAIILKRKRKLVALLLLPYRYTVPKIVLCSSSRYRGLVCSVWLWYFLTILTYFLHEHRNRKPLTRIKFWLRIISICMPWYLLTINIIFVSMKIPFQYQILYCQCNTRGIKIAVFALLQNVHQRLTTRRLIL